MIGVSQLLLDVRDIGDSVVSTSQDIQLLLSPGDRCDSKNLPRIKHARDLIDNIISLLTFFATLDGVNIDRGEELTTEVKRIEFSCLGLHSILSQSIDEVKMFHEHQSQISKFLQIINKSANRIVTISFLAEEPLKSQQVHDVCYKSKLICEQHCDGACYKDESVEDSACPEYVEVFTQSPLTHVESGVEDGENLYWHKPPIPVKRNDVEGQPHFFISSTGKIEVLTVNDDSTVEQLQTNLCESKVTSGDSQQETETLSTNIYDENGIKEQSESNSIYKKPVTGKSKITKTECLEISLINATEFSGSESTVDRTELSNTLMHAELVYTTESTNSNALPENFTDISTSLYLETKNFEQSTIPHEISTESTTYVYSSEFSPSYDTTTEITTETSHITEETTTPIHETTTQDLYKFSQDIYSVAQDLSTKANEISSMTSDISSKISSISSIMSDISSYDDDELSKKVQSVNKLTQDMNSKTSEISSLCSSMSSLASDISSASSDMPSADRTNPLRTSPWQKIAAKAQDLVAAAQAVVSASQEILLKIDALVTATLVMTVGPQVAVMGYDVTAKTQLVISETLGLVSAVIDLISFVDS